MNFKSTHKHTQRVKLIFNPGSGENDKSPVQLMDVIREMQACNFIPEPYLIETDCDLPRVVQDAIAYGIKLFVVCGGDGTISTVARALIGTKGILGIIPTGTQNNVALSLGIPSDIPGAMAILKNGKRLQVDMGIVVCGNTDSAFIEVCTVGLLSNLFSSGDDIQHGNIARMGDFFTTLTTSPPSEIHIVLDNKQEIRKVGHVVMVSNTPYVGRHYQMGALDTFTDGLLDVTFYSDLTKLELVEYILNEPGVTTQEDARIQHFCVRNLVIETTPAMPVMADGIALGEGSVRIEVRPKALTVMVGPEYLKELKESGERVEE